MKKSHIFWNCIFDSIVVISCIFCIKIYILIQILQTLYLLYIVMNNSIEYYLYCENGYNNPDYIKIPSIMKSNIFYVIYLIFYVFIKGCKWVYLNPIQKFNNWINKENALNFKSFTKLKKEESEM